MREKILEGQILVIKESQYFAERAKVLGSLI